MGRLDLIHCVEPFKPQPVTEQHAYLRLLGTDGYYHNCTEDELAQLRGWFEPFETAHVLPNNVAKGGGDILRFREILGQR